MNRYMDSRGRMLIRRGSSRVDALQARAQAATLADAIAREAVEAGDRRARAWSRDSMSDPLPVRHPTPVLSVPAQGPQDCRPIAVNREPCPRCETRGDLGCAHQRPFVAEAG